MSDQEAQRVGLPARIAIPGTLLITAASVVESVDRCISMDLKESGNCLVLASAPVERDGLEHAYKLHRRVADLIAAGKVRAAHDVSDGGLAVAVAEMCIASNLGATIEEPGAGYGFDLFHPATTPSVLEMNEGHAEATGARAVGLASENLTPDKIMTPEAFANASSE